MEKTILLSLIVVCLLICTPLTQAKKHLGDTKQEAGVATDANGDVCTYGSHHDECKAVRYPYWSTHSVNVGPEYKQVHITILNDISDFGAGKTKLVLSLCIDRIMNCVDLSSHIINIPKPIEKNATLDAGYFIVPRSLVESADGRMMVGMNILEADGPDTGGTVNHQLNDTVFSVDDYYQTT